jgi:hypothetical protein
MQRTGQPLDPALLMMHVAITGGHAVGYGSGSLLGWGVRLTNPRRMFDTDGYWSRLDPGHNQSAGAPEMTSERQSRGPLLVSFAAGHAGPWRIDRISAVIGDSLAPAARLDMVEGDDTQRSTHSMWILRGVTSNARYTNRNELQALTQRQQGLGRPESTRAALIPMRKTEAWWALAQDERRSILEEQSHHISIGMQYLPAIARRLHHSRELGEPFDFLTWFEYAPQDADAFEEVVQRLRATKEWEYVDREVDVRLSRDAESRLL